MTLTAIVMLGVGTYLFRLSGPLLATRFALPGSVQKILTRATTVLLTALAATAALCPDGHFDSWSRPIAVGVAGVLAWRRAPFAVVVIVAAAVAAGLRASGLR